MTEINNIQFIHDRLFRLLEYFDEFCRENNLTYWISNGTLLGCVKYNGFIPWDDDIDVMMPATDYERLLNMDIHDERYSLLCKEKNERWRYPYAKLSDNGTLVEEKAFDLGCSYGLFIDIFPVDKWNPNRLLARKEARVNSVLCRLMYNSVAEEFRTEKGGIRKAILYFVFRLSKCIGHRKICNILEKRSSLHADENSNYVGSLRWAPYGEKEIVCQEDIFPLTELMFNGMTVFAPRGYKKYLTRLYGDYQTDPPIEKQKSNHTLKVYSI